MNLAVLIILQSEGRRGSNGRRKCNRGWKGKREREREIKKLKRERERERARTTTVQKRVNEMKTGAKRERGSVVFELKQEEQ